MTVGPHSISVRTLAAQFNRAVEVVDSHTEGNPTRVVVGGVSTPPGVTLAERQQWAIAHDDALRRLVVDVAFGGDFYVIVDADRLHLHLTPDSHRALEDAARSIVVALNEQLTIRHPDRPGINRCYETLFTSSHVTGADVKQTIV